VNFNSSIPHSGESLDGGELVYLVVFFSPDGPDGSVEGE
jgi:hypothetical protein